MYNGKVGYAIVQYISKDSNNDGANFSLILKKRVLLASP